MVERMKTMSEWGLSHHRPVLVKVRRTVRKWRRSGQSDQRVPKIKWELLQDEGKIED